MERNKAVERVRMGVKEYKEELLQGRGDGMGED